MSLRAFRGMLLENWGLKLLSLAFATLLWLFVVGEKRSEVSLSLPLELIQVPEDMVVVRKNGCEVLNTDTTFLDL